MENIFKEFDLVKDVFIKVDLYISRQLTYIMLNNISKVDKHVLPEYFELIENDRLTKDVLSLYNDKERQEKLCVELKQNMRIHNASFKKDFEYMNKVINQLTDIIYNKKPPIENGISIDGDIIPTIKISSSFNSFVKIRTVLVAEFIKIAQVLHDEDQVKLIEPDYLFLSNDEPASEKYCQADTNSLKKLFTTLEDACISTLAFEEIKRGLRPADIDSDSWLMGIDDTYKGSQRNLIAILVELSKKGYFSKELSDEEIVLIAKNDFNTIIKSSYVSNKGNKKAVAYFLGVDKIPVNFKKYSVASV